MQLFLKTCIYFITYFVIIFINLNIALSFAVCPSVPGQFLSAALKDSGRDVCLALAAASDSALLTTEYSLKEIYIITFSVRVVETTRGSTVSKRCDDSLSSEDWEVCMELIQVIFQIYYLICILCFSIHFFINFF